MMSQLRSKKRVAIVAPVFCEGGIASVINAVLKSDKIKNNYELSFFHTSNYKDSNFFVNTTIFLKAVYDYVLKLMLRKVDLVHIHTSYGRSFYRKAFFIFLSKIFGVKIVLHFHSSKFDDFFITVIGLKKGVIEFLLKRTDAIVLLCRNWKEKIEKKYAVKNAYVINNPIPLDLDKIRKKEQSSFSNYVNILFLGFLIKTKGIYDLVEIAEKLRETNLEHKIIVGGKGEEEKRFLKSIIDKNLDNIEYLGWVSGKDKLDLFSNSDIFLLPSYKEGMPMVILEAMCFSLPIISTKIAGIPEIVDDGKNGYLLAPGDIEGFVKKIKSLILDTTLRTEYGRNSRIFAERFDKEKISEEWHILYKKILYGN